MGTLPRNRLKSTDITKYLLQLYEPVRLYVIFSSILADLNEQVRCAKANQFLGEPDWYFFHTIQLIYSDNSNLAEQSHGAYVYP